MTFTREAIFSTSMNACAFCGGSDEAEPQCLPNSVDPPCEPCRKILELDSKILRTRSLLNQLLEQRRVLKVAMNHAHDPMGKLPPEIVSRIFTLCMFTGEKLSLYHAFLHPIPRTIIPPLLFGGVCKRWRQIAWSTPRLWTRMNIYCDAGMVDWQTEMVEEWLARSGSLPLSISLCLRANQELVDTDCAQQFLPMTRLLSNQSHRWEDLEISLPHSLISQLQGDVQGVPLLRTIRIADSFEHENGGPIQFGHDAPSLVSVDIEGYDFRSIGIDWQHVAEVKLGQIYADECLRLFQLASSMNECNLIVMANGHGGFPIPINEVVSSSLERLVVYFGGDTDASTVLTKVSLPSLQSLVYDGASISILSPFLARSSSPLTRLHLSEVDGVEDDFIQLFHATPLLRILRAFHLDLGNRFLGLLATTALSTTDGQGNGFLPHLAELSLFGGDDYSLQVLPQIFASGPRLPNQRMRPWEKMEVGFYVNEEYGEYIPEDLLAKLLEIEERGIELGIRNEITGNNLIEISRRYYRSLNAEDQDGVDEYVEGDEDVSDDEGIYAEEDKDEDHSDDEDQ